MHFTEFFDFAVGHGTPDTFETPAGLVQSHHYIGWFHLEHRRQLRGEHLYVAILGDNFWVRDDVLGRQVEGKHVSCTPAVEDHPSSDNARLLKVAQISNPVARCICLDEMKTDEPEPESRHGGEKDQCHEDKPACIPFLSHSLQP